LDAGIGEVRKAMTASTSMQPNSIDAAGSGTDDGTLSDRLVAACCDLEGIEELAALKQAMRPLSPDDRDLLYWRYFLEETQAALGSRFGVTQMQISRRLSRVLVQLQRNLIEQGDAAARTCESKGRASMTVAVAAAGTDTRSAG
jgi:RNA polymerase sigma-B factor